MRETWKRFRTETASVADLIWAGIVIGALIGAFGGAVVAAYRIIAWLPCATLGACG